MTYNGIKLEELTAEKWDNRPRKLLVWGAVNDGFGIKSLIHEEYIEYCIDAKSNSTNNTIWEAYIDGHMRAWYHAAEIPKEEPNQVQNIDEMIKILNAYKEGKTIEHRFRNRDIGDFWGCIDMQNPEWNWGIFEYRVKPDLEEIVHKKFNAKIKSVKKARRMTNRELAELMATGKVEKCYPCNVNGRDLTRVYRAHSYYRNGEDSPCAKSILIRYIGTNEWVKPLIEE